MIFHFALILVKHVIIEEMNKLKIVLLVITIVFFKKMLEIVSIHVQLDIIEKINFVKNAVIIAKLALISLKKGIIIAYLAIKIQNTNIY